jgi:hypothetical protein
LEDQRRQTIQARIISEINTGRKLPKKKNPHTHTSNVSETNNNPDHRQFNLDNKTSFFRTTKSIKEQH